MMEKPTFPVAAQQCNECLFSPNRIVSAERMKEILAACAEQDHFFVCHKATLAGVTVCCRGYFDHYGKDRLTTRLAMYLGLVEDVDVEDAGALACLKQQESEQA